MNLDLLHLVFIQECIQRINEYVGDGEKAFLASRLIQDAVLRNLQTLSESTQRLSDDLKAQHSRIDWRRLSGFRNILVHDYLGVDVLKCWAIIEDELPDLEKEVAEMIRRIELGD
jgi:uncharacterized protein with HEPN domain